MVLRSPFLLLCPHLCAPCSREVLRNLRDTISRTRMSTECNLVLEMKIQLSATDLLALASMKDAANRDK